jgi:hypothetical protein
MRRVRVRKDRLYSKEGKKGRKSGITKEETRQLKSHGETERTLRSRKQPVALIPAPWGQGEGWGRGMGSGSGVLKPQLQGKRSW